MASGLFVPAFRPDVWAAPRTKDPFTGIMGGKHSAKRDRTSAVAQQPQDFVHGRVWFGFIGPQYHNAQFSDEMVDLLLVLGLLAEQQGQGIIEADYGRPTEMCFDAWDVSLRYCS